MYFCIWFFFFFIGLGICVDFRLFLKYKIILSASPAFPSAYNSFQSDAIHKMYYYVTYTIISVLK